MEDVTRGVAMGRAMNGDYHPQDEKRVQGDALKTISFLLFNNISFS